MDNKKNLLLDENEKVKKVQNEKLMQFFVSACRFAYSHFSLLIIIITTCIVLLNIYIYASDSIHPHTHFGIHCFSARLWLLSSLLCSASQHACDACANI